VITQWHFAVVPGLVVVALLAAYGVGVRRVAGQAAPWPALRTATFVVLGVGSYAVVTLGYLGVYSPYLRWAFAAQSALLLLVVPALIALGRPVALARKALGDNGRRRLDAFLGSRLVRLLSHPFGGPALLLVMLLLFLTPLPPEIRNHASAVAVTQVLLPLFGLLALIPVASGEEPASTTTMAIGFLIAFFELIADALPGILLRLHNGIIGTLAVPGARPPWLPTALRDQQLSGDVLWFLGEAIDLPFLAWLVVRWIRADAKEAAVVDARLDAEPHDDRPWWEVERSDRAED
jgi:cytochrome c oxidase assembly factor CtaG